MDAKHPAVDDGPEAHVVKHLAAVAPHARAAVLFHALVVEAVHLGDLSGFVVAADEGHAVRVADFEREEEQEGLDRVEAAVDIVACRKPSQCVSLFCLNERETRTEEEVVCVGTLTADAEQLEEVKELAVDVTADLREGSRVSA